METAEARNSQSGCFHCGEAIPADLDLEIEFAGKRHRVCCAGCQAVFQSIAGAGLGRYYQFRQALGRKVTGDMQSRQQAWQAVDDRVSLWGVPNEKGLRDLQLQTEGIRCAACAWLIRSQLESARGIESVQVNLGTGYTRIEWDPAQTRLSKIAMTLFGLGYVPHLPITSEEEKGRRQEQRDSLKRLGVAGLGMMQVMMYAVGLYTGDAMGMSPASRGFLTWVSLLVTLPVVLYSGRVFFIGAWQGVRMGRPGMDLPVAIAIGLAFIASCYNFFMGQGEVWFDSVVMFIFFLTLGRHVEMVLRHRNVQAGTALARILPEWANKVDAAELSTVPAIDLVAGDRVRVAPNEIIPADGKIMSGKTRVDEALLTGESRPLVREPGNDVIAGTRNLEQPIEICVTAASHETTVSALGRLLVSSRSRPEDEPGLPAILVPAFVVGVLLLAGGTFVYWLQADAHLALPTALAVLVASCPCALSLALPAVHSAASFRLLKDGILLTRTSALHDLLTVDTILFDKTGTLTLGRPEIEDMELNPYRQDCVQSIAIDRAVALEAHSTHPVARAFRRADIGQAAEDVDSQTPGGLRGQFSGVPWLIGNADYLQRFTGKPAPEGDRALIYLADQDDWYAWFSLRDSLRPGTAHTLATLAAEGFDMRMLSGDGEPAVEQVAGRLNFSHWRAGLSAVDKLNEIQSLQAEGHTILMVGDGANDAPVLSAADVSMTVQGATELANSTADFILTGESLEPVVMAFKVARKASGLIRQNLAWALIYNVSILPLAMSGYLQPWMAALGMSASSLLVVLNAARLSRPTHIRFEAEPA